MDPARLSALNTAIRAQGFSVADDADTLTVTWTTDAVTLKLPAFENKSGGVTVRLLADIVTIELGTKSVALGGTLGRPGLSFTNEDGHVRLDLGTITTRRNIAALGHADFWVENVNVNLRLGAGELWAVPIAGGDAARCTLAFDLTMVDAVDAVDRFLQRLPMKPNPPGGRLAKVEFSLDRGTRLLIDGSHLPEFCPDRVLKGVPTVVKQTLPELSGPILGDLGVALTTASLRAVNTPKVRSSETGLVLEGLTLELNIGDKQVTLVDGRLGLDKQLCLRAEDGFLKFQLKGSVALKGTLKGEDVLTLVLHSEHYYRLDFDGDSLRLVVRTGSDGAQSPRPSFPR